MTTPNLPRWTGLAAPPGRFAACQGTVCDSGAGCVTSPALDPAEREALIGLLLDSSAEAIYGVDARGRCVFVNRAFLRLTGYDDADALIGRRVHDLIHHRHADGSPYPASECPLVRTYRDGGELHGDDETFWRRDGTPFPVEYWSHPLRRDGKVIGAVVSFFDIGARLRDEARLRQAAAVYESTLEGVLITDPDANIVAVNQAFIRITGYAEAEVIGRNPRLLASGRQALGFYREMWHALTTEGGWEGEIWNRRKNGETYPEWLAINGVRDGHGRLINYVAVFSDISRLKQSEARLEQLAHYDPLTGLPNRLLFQSRLAHALNIARRRASRLALLYLDLDRFKNVNDSLGHPAGDELLVAIARRLGQRMREEDTLARLGGDEFIILLERIDAPETAALVARQILDLLAEPFQLSDGHEVFVSASIGISLFPEDGGDVTELVRNADTAMYQIKDNGRDGYRFYTESLPHAASARLELETRLRRALERQEFELHYQPQVAVADGRVLGVEALLRWRHPERGLIRPDHFIPLAEESGLIVPIGDWVLERACAQARAWLDQGLPPLTIAVNLSMRQLRQRGLAGRVGEILAETGLEARWLELEITESMMMNRADPALETLRELKALGVGLAMDDFGTGYSSLAHLKHFAIDRLKIDRGFVRDLPADRGDLEIAATIIAMARNLGLEVLAEGVETHEQLAFLSERGCDAYQGYLFSRPLDADAIPALLTGAG